MCNREKWRNFVYYRKKYEKSTKYYVNQFMHKKSTCHTHIKMCINMWIMWITYLPRSCSPIFTTSPAPIVINRSPCVQFSIKSFQSRRKSGSIHMEYRVRRFFPADFWKKCRDYPFLLQHRYQPGRHDLQG